VRLISCTYHHLPHLDKGRQKKLPPSFVKPPVNIVS